MIKIIVTGGAGFIGSHLVDRLINEGYKVIVIDNLSTGKKENLNPKAKFYKIDIRSPKIFEIFKKEKPEIVFHLAAQIDIRKSVEDPFESAKINILGSLNLIENFVKLYFAKKSHGFTTDKNVRISSREGSHEFAKFIFASTGGAIYGDAKIIPTPENYPEFPVSPYGIEKLIIEKYLNYYYQVYGLSYTALRLANVYGPRQNSKGEAGVVAIFCDKILSGKQPIINGDGKQTRDFVYVEDVVDAFILAMLACSADRKKDKVGVYNIGTCKETNINTIFRKLKKLTGSSCKEIHGSAKPGEQRRSCLDFSKAKKELGWQPKTSLDEGLLKTVEWFTHQIKS